MPLVDSRTDNAPRRPTCRGPRSSAPRQRRINHGEPTDHARPRRGLHDPVQREGDRPSEAARARRQPGAAGRHRDRRVVRRLVADAPPPPAAGRGRGGGRADRRELVGAAGLVRAHRPHAAGRGVHPPGRAHPDPGRLGGGPRVAGGPTPRAAVARRGARHALHQPQHRRPGCPCLGGRYGVPS